METKQDALEKTSPRKLVAYDNQVVTHLTITMAQVIQVANHIEMEAVRVQVNQEMTLLKMVTTKVQVVNEEPLNTCNNLSLLGQTNTIF